MIHVPAINITLVACALFMGKQKETNSLLTADNCIVHLHSLPAKWVYQGNLVGDNKIKEYSSRFNCMFRGSKTVFAVSFSSSSSPFHVRHVLSNLTEQPVYTKIITLIMNYF